MLVCISSSPTANQGPEERKNQPRHGRRVWHRRPRLPSYGQMPAANVIQSTAVPAVRVPHPAPLTTITPANQDHLDEICVLHRSWGIPDSEHIVRPLAQRGFSQQGTQVDRTNLDPELTVSQDGVFWHPLSTDADMLIRREIFPLSSAVECLLEQLQTPAERLTFT